MSLNKILPYNKIKEIDECMPISPPSLSSENSEQNELFYYYSFETTFNYKLDLNNFNYIYKKLE